jgi:general secretion pathway protein G
MKNVFKVRKSGFTLVELLIVTVIIGILAGMMMLTMGSATDGAEASKLINDLRLLKSASLLYFFDWDRWPSEASTGSLTDSVQTSLEAYMDKPFSLNYKGGIRVGRSGDRVLYGLSPDTISIGALRKLQKNGSVYNNVGAPYNASTGGPVYTIIK